MRTRQVIERDADRWLGLGLQVHNTTNRIEYVLRILRLILEVALDVRSKI